MAKQSQADRDGQISRFYQTELLSSEECGAYLSNLEIYKISEDLGFDITFSTNEFILAELFGAASDAKRLNELSRKLIELFDTRVKEYEKIKNIYPKASQEIEAWISKCNKTIEKIKQQTEQGE